MLVRKLTAIADDKKVLAAEFAFGLLDGETLFNFEQRLKKDDALSDEVAFWEDRLSTTLMAAGRAKPPKSVLDRAELSLFGSVRETSKSPARFAWKRLLVGVVVVKLSLLTTWYVVQSSRTGDAVRPSQTIEAPVLK